MNQRINRGAWRLRVQRFLGAALFPGITVFAVTFGWWISRSPNTARSARHASAANPTNYPRAWGPSTSADCGTTGRPPPPINTPFGRHLYANTSPGVVHALPAMAIADTLMPPPENARRSKSSAATPSPNGPGRASAAAQSGPALAGQTAESSGADTALAAGGHSSSGRPVVALNETAQDDVAAVGQLLEEYRRAFGAMPVGELNDEIVRRLQGDNPLGIAVLPKDHPALNADGELLDRWGTPYRFHPESAWVMTVRSAGPDRRMWTSDDILSSEGNPPTAEILLTGGGQ
jgi:hypothetical protein